MPLVPQKTYIRAVDNLWITGGKKGGDGGEGGPSDKNKDSFSQVINRLSTRCLLFIALT
jgi:hypothetical protein